MLSMKICGWLRQPTHNLDAVFGLAQAGQASVLYARSFKQARQIVSWPLLGPEHKKQRLPEKKAGRAVNLKLTIQVDSKSFAHMIPLPCAVKS